MTAPWAPSRSFWEDRPVAVTGGTGFVGSHVVDQLVEAGAAVVVLVRDLVPATSIVRRWQDRVAQVWGSVEDLRAVERLLGDYRARTVLHLAAQSQVRVANQDPVPTFEANIAGTWSVLEAARRCPTVDQVVLASSDKAYGDTPGLPCTEDMPLAAVNPYDVSKACAEMLGRCYAKSFGLPVTIARCGNIFGPGDTNWDRLVPGVVRDLLAGRRPAIRSDGSSTRDYLYVLDAARSYLRLAEALAEEPALSGEAFNFAMGRPLSVLELVELIEAAAGVHLEPDVQGIATHEIAHQHLSSDKARKLLGWEPAFDLEEALALTVSWYRSELAGGFG